MDALEVLGGLALFAAVVTGISWWAAGRRGVEPLLERSRDRRLDDAEAQYTRGPGTPSNQMGSWGGIGF